MIASVLNSKILSPLRSEEGRRNLKKLSIAAIAISLIATIVVYSGGISLPAAIALSVEIITWGILPGITGLWQIYINAYDLMHEKQGPPCPHCARTMDLLV